MEEEVFKIEVMKIYEKFLEAGKPSFIEFIHLLYWRLFNETCQCFSISKEGDRIFLKGTRELISERRIEVENGASRCSGPAQIDIDKLLGNPEFISGVRASVEISRFGLLYLWNSVIVYMSYIKNKFWVYLFAEDREEAEKFLSLVEIFEISRKKSNVYSFLVKNDNGVEEKKLSFDSQKIDLRRNYNDDLPWNELMRFVGEDKEGLAILHGPAGTGKTTLIKKLIQDNPGKEFVLINSRDLENPDNEGYLEYFLENKNRIFILEDCERLLLSRNNGGGSNQLVTILNMSDGLLGSTLKTKFICTFNTNLENIDSALLRKGRMRIKYYVGPLCLEKTRNLTGDETIREKMTLAEIYNGGENDFSKTGKRKIGFM